MHKKQRHKRRLRGRNQQPDPNVDLVMAEVDLCRHHRKNRPDQQDGSNDQVAADVFLTVVCVVAHKSIW